MKRGPRRGRPPKPPDEVRTVRRTVLLTEREDATLSRACGGRGVATMLREAGLREAAAMATTSNTVALDAAEAFFLERWRTAALASRHVLRCAGGGPLDDWAHKALLDHESYRVPLATAIRAIRAQQAASTMKAPGVPVKVVKR